MSSYHYRGKRQFRRSPLSDLIFVSLALLLVVILAAVILRLCVDKPGAGQPGSTDSPSPTVTDSEPTSSPSPLTPADIPWYLTLVNSTHALPEDFTVETTQIGSSKLSFDTRAYDALSRMLSDCRAAGLQPLVCSAYRTQETQESLFQNKVNRLIAQGYSESDATVEAGKEVAVPGTSEHQLGLAADIVDINNQNLNETQESTDVQKWLMEHCWEYGFILRYPNDKRELTRIIYEPWHYRYVGEEAAKEITESGLCLEEYLSQQYGLD